MEDFLAKQKTREDSECSWSLNVADLGDDLDLSVKNPHKVEEVDERTPAEIFSSIERLHGEADEILEDALVWDLWPEDEDDLFADPISYDDIEEEDEE